MPLLLCPNDNSGMTSVSRAGVEFDICPTCRGVWLDRGELEKLMSASRDQGEASAAGSQPSTTPLQQHPMTGPGQGVPPLHYDPRYSGEQGEWGEAGERGEGGRYGTDDRRKRFDLFDIFG